MSDGAAAPVLLRGGLLIGPDGAEPGDLLLAEGVIAAVGAAATQRVSSGSVVEVVDVGGRYVLPGGVDPHVHLDSVFRGRRTADDFASGANGAVAGGTTSLLDFCFPAPGELLTDAVLRWRDRVVAQDPLARLGCHLVLVEPTDAVLDQLAECVELGVRSLKLYLAYPGRNMSTDGALLRTLQRAAALDLTVLVHAENGPAIEVLIGQALAGGHREPAWHALTRPAELEAEAVHRACVLAELAGAKLHVVHVSGAAALQVVVDARRRGVRVTAETCPHYLLLDSGTLAGTAHQAAGFVCSPPTRDAADQDRLWAGLRAHEIAFVASDHCPFLLHRDKVMGDDFTQILNGMPGVEQRIMLLHHFGVRTGRLTLPDLVRLTSTAAADLFDLPGGRLEVGAPADVLVFDPDRELTLSAATQHCAVDYLPYEGITVRGAVESVYLAGELVVSGGHPVTRAGTSPARLLHLSRFELQETSR